ncbi:hypothetical protein E7X58_10505 [Streptomyces sp. A1499]|nr:hypothetical protein E7X58_10505 [Streptomyces sp. A1499]
MFITTGLLSGEATGPAGPPGREAARSAGPPALRGLAAGPGHSFSRTLGGRFGRSPGRRFSPAPRGRWPAPGPDTPARPRTGPCARGLPPAASRR